VDIDWENIDCYVCCNHCDTLEFGEAPVTGVYTFAIRIHETIRLLTFSFFVGDEITLDADLLNEDSVSQITVYYINEEDEGVIVHQCNINVSISSSVPNPCPLPDFVPDCPDCGDANYELTLDGEVVGIGAITCNETTEIPIDGFITPCEDATYDLNDTDGNLITSGSIVCGANEIIVAPNADIELFDSDGNLLYDLSLLSNTPNFQVISDSVANLEDSAGGAISSTNILAQGAANITAPDATLTLNGGAWTSKKSNSTNDIDLVFVSGVDVPTVSLTATTITIANLDKSTFIKGLFAANQAALDTTNGGIITIDADNAGSFTTLTTDGSSGTVTFEVNGVLTALPFTLAVNDTLEAFRTISTAAGWYKITGTHT